MARRRSNTLGTKLKEPQPQPNKTPDYEVLSDPPLVKVRIRRSNRACRLIEIPSMLTGARLFQTLQKQLYVAESSQVVIVGGKRIESSEETRGQFFSFPENTVIHVHDRRNCQKNSINVCLKFLNHQFLKYWEFPLSSQSHSQITHAIQQQLQGEAGQSKLYELFQSGRLINSLNTFQQEAVQDDSIIIVFSSNQNMQVLRQIQQRQIQMMDAIAGLNKRTSFGSTDALDAANFKKKPKCTVYRSMVIPESKEIVWEEDNNSEVSRKNLIKRLIKKRPRRVEKPDLPKQSESSSTKNRIENPRKNTTADSRNAKSVTPMRWDLCRLYDSQPLSKTPQVCNLKPPEFVTDFFEEAEQLEFQQEIDEREFEKLKLSAPVSSLKNSLASSIGKNRGTFIPVLGCRASVEPQEEEQTDF